MEYIAYRILQNGLLEELRPDETTDLLSSGVERFIIFRTDRSFRFLLNDRSFDWGATHITGLTLKKLADVDLAAMAAWLDVPGGASRPIADQEFVNLAEPGVERLFTRPREYHILVNTRPKEVAAPNLSFWEARLPAGRTEPNHLLHSDLQARANGQPGGQLGRRRNSPPEGWDVIQCHSH